MALPRDLIGAAKLLAYPQEVLWGVAGWLQTVRVHLSVLPAINWRKPLFFTNIGSHRISCNGGHQIAHRVKVHARRGIKLIKINVLT